MSFLSNLRQKWSRHDEKLAEQAYENRDTEAELEEHEEIMNTGLLGANAEGSLVSALNADREIARYTESEDELEHEEPTAEEAASNELAAGEESSS